MSTQKYGVVFTTANPADETGLTPTFIVFAAIDGTSVAVPAITEAPAGSGLYTFTATLLPNVQIYFNMDGTVSAPAASRYVPGILYYSDIIDTQLTIHGTTLAAMNTSLFALGTTNAALGTTNVALGTTNVALGTTNVALGTTNVAIGTSNIALGMTNVAIGTTINAREIVIDAKLGSTASVFGDSSTLPVDVYGFLKRAMEFSEGDATFSKDTGVWTVKDRAGLTTIASKTLTNSVDTVTKS